MKKKELTAVGFGAILLLTVVLAGAGKKQANKAVSEEKQASLEQEVLEESLEKSDLPMMLMVNGELYMSTGTESTNSGRCGVMDGEITSQVGENTVPTENDQSNFGTGYGYQYGSFEGILEVEIDGRWMVFSTEKVLTQSETLLMEE